MRPSYFTGFALAVAAVATQAQTAPAVVTDAVIKGKIATATITTPSDDRLEGLSAPGGIAMLHAVKRAGMYRSAIPFAANRPRRLSAHGYHIMLMRKLPKGSSVPMTLIFAKAGAVKVVFVVR